VNENEFFELVAERDAARIRVYETYASLREAEDRARTEREPFESHRQFRKRFREEESAYQRAELQFQSLNQRVEFALEAAKRETFVLAITSARAQQESKVEP
jgi:hypothetical protein